jgi:hypothetical protein
VSNYLRIFILVILCFILIKSKSQECGFVPLEPIDSLLLLNVPGYEDNNKLLKILEKYGYHLPKDYFDSIDAKGKYKGKKLKLKDFKEKKDKNKNGRLVSVPSGQAYMIPIIVVVHQDNNGNNPSGYSDSDMFEGIQLMNMVFSDNGAPFHFYLQNISYISNSPYFSMPEGEEHEQYADGVYSVQGYVNIHVVNDFEKGIAGTALSTPSSTCFIKADRIRTNTLTHEIGHCMGLNHTHNGRCWSIFGSQDNEDCGDCKQESVSRIRRSNCLFKNGKKLCEINGDYLCDTPAEQNLSNIILSNTCDVVGYTQFGTDNWGARWTPQEFNIMGSANVRACRSEFTIGQVARMVGTIENTSLFIAYLEDEPELNGLTIVCDGLNQITYSLSYPNYIKYYSCKLRCNSY